jgi:glycosyltransferase involved in cell wall biosynthesis
MLNAQQGNALESNVAILPATQDGGLRLRSVEKESAPGKPLITVITVVFNGAKTLERTIQSVINQSYDNIEYIIVDGASTDGTLDIIRSYEHAIDYWVSEPDAGIYDAMNKGIALASGDIIGIINSDDRYLPDAVATVAATFVNQPSIGYCYGSLELVDLDGKSCGTARPVPRKLLDRRILRETAIPHPTMFVRRDIYNRYGAFDSRLKLAGDFELIARLHRLGVAGSELPATLAEFCIGGASTNPLILQEKRRIALEFGLPPVVAWYDWFIKRLIMSAKRILPSRAVGLIRWAKESAYHRGL